MSTLVQLETHLHTSEVSQCGRIPAREMIRRYHAAGYGAVVVTDHFLPGRFRGRRHMPLQRRLLQRLQVL